MISKIIIKFNQQKIIKCFTKVCLKPIRLIASILLLCFSFSTQAMFAPQSYCPMDLYMLALMGGTQDNSKQVDSDKELRDRLKAIDKSMDALEEAIDEVWANLEDTLGDDGSIVGQVLDFENSEWEQKDGDEAYCTEKELEALGIETEGFKGGGRGVSLSAVDVYTLASLSKDPSFFQLSFLKVFTEKALFTLIPSAGAVAITNRATCGEAGGNWDKPTGSRRFGCFCSDGTRVTNTDQGCNSSPAPPPTCTLACLGPCQRRHSTKCECVLDNDSTCSTSSIRNGVCKDGQCKARASCDASNCQVVDSSDPTKCKTKCTGTQVCDGGTCKARASCDASNCQVVDSSDPTKCKTTCTGTQVCDGGTCKARASCDASNCQVVDSSDPTKCKTTCTGTQVCDGGTCKAQAPTCSPSTCKSEECEKCDGNTCKDKECSGNETCVKKSKGGSGQCEAPQPPPSPVKDCEDDNTCEEEDKECTQTGAGTSAVKKCISKECKDWLTWRKCGGKKLTRARSSGRRVGGRSRTSRRSRDHKGYVGDICKNPSACTEITTRLNPTPWNKREQGKCSKYLASLKKMQKRLEDLEKEREKIEEQLWDKRMAELAGEEETEADTTCFDCNIRRIKELRSALNPPPSGWQILGDVLTSLGGAYVGYKGVKHANELRDRQGFSAQPGLGLNLAYPFIMKGLYGGGLMGSSASLACSPTMFNSMFPGSVFMNPFMGGGFHGGGSFPGGGFPGGGWPGGGIGGAWSGGIGGGWPGGGIGGAIMGGYPGGIGGGWPGGGIGGAWSGGIGGGWPGGGIGGAIMGGYPGGIGGGWPGGGIGGAWSGGIGGGWPGGGIGGAIMGGYPGGGIGGGYPGGGIGGGYPGGGIGAGVAGTPGMAQYQHQMQAYMEYQQSMMAYRMAEMQNWQQKQQAASSLYQEIFKIQMQIQQIMYGGSSIGGGIGSGIGAFSIGGGGGSSSDDNYDDFYDESPGR